MYDRAILELAAEGREGGAARRVKIVLPRVVCTSRITEMEFGFIFAARAKTPARATTVYPRR